MGSVAPAEACVAQPCTAPAHVFAIPMDLLPVFAPRIPSKPGGLPNNKPSVDLPSTPAPAWRRREAGAASYSPSKFIFSASPELGRSHHEPHIALIQSS